MSQTGSDGDQTLSDADQTGADSDQSSADRDQLAADRDQAASDRELLTTGGNPRAHDLNRDVRRDTTRERAQTAQARMDAAELRDGIADARDVAGLARDRAADARDLVMARQDSAPDTLDLVPAVDGAELVARAAAQRARAAEHRADAAEHRMLAAADRDIAAHDRELACVQRRRSLLDRETLARELAVAETDALTGARTRAAGLRDLEHELERCRRTSGRLALASVDVAGMHACNDAGGDAAGDDLLTTVVATIRAHLRSYDPVVRVGGDEFVCAMSDTTLFEARERFNAIAASLAGSPQAAAIATGFAALAPGETLTELIARADGERLAGHDHDR